MDGNGQVGYFDWGTERDYLFDELKAINNKRKNNESFNLKQIHDIYEKDRDFFPALIMAGEVCINRLKRLDKASQYLNEAVLVAERLIPDNYEGKIYSFEEPFSYYSALKGVVHIENEKGNKILADKCYGIWVDRLPEHSFARLGPIM